MDIRPAAQEYLASITTRLSSRTQRGYAQRLFIFVAWCEVNQVQLEEVNNQVVQRFLQYLYSTHRPHKGTQAHISMHTLAGYVRVISAFLYWCLQSDRYAASVSFGTVRAIHFDETLFL